MHGADSSFWRGSYYTPVEIFLKKSTCNLTYTIIIILQDLTWPNPRTVHIFKNFQIIAFPWWPKWPADHPISNWFDICFSHIQRPISNSSDIEHFESPVSKVQYQNNLIGTLCYPGEEISYSFGKFGGWFFSGHALLIMYNNIYFEKSRAWIWLWFWS